MRTTIGPRRGLVIAIHPTSRGFGWVLFEAPGAIATWGVVDVSNYKEDKNRRALARIGKLLERYSTSVLILEDFEHKPARRGARIKRLCRAMLRLAAHRGIEVRVYPRAAVNACFRSVGAKTRHEIAQAVALHVDALRHMLPARRRLWDPEHPRMGLFQAAALAITYYTLAGAEEPP